MHTFPGDSPMCWHHSLILIHVSENSRCLQTILRQYHCFQPIKVSSYTYHSLILIHVSENSRCLQTILRQYHCFQPIKVSSYTYPCIPIHDRMPRIPLLSLTCLIMSTDKVITQTIFVVLFTSRSLSHLGETPGCLIWSLPQVLACHQLSTNCILSLQIQHDGQPCLLFSSLWLVGEGLFITLGISGHLSMTTSTPCDFHNSIRALLSHQP